MPSPLDPAALPDNIRALQVLLLQREDAHAAELNAARAGLKEQVLRNELLKARLAKLLRERFGASSEKLRGAIEQLELLLGDLEEQLAAERILPQLLLRQRSQAVEALTHVGHPSGKPNAHIRQRH